MHRASTSFGSNCSHTAAASVVDRPLWTSATVGGYMAVDDGYSSSTLATAGTSDGAVWLWDTETSQSLCALRGHTKCVTALAFSPADRNLLATGGDDEKVLLWHVVEGEDGWKGELRCELSDHVGCVTSIAFTPDGTTVVAASHRGAVTLWDVESGTRCTSHTIQGHGGRSINAMAVAWSPAVLNDDDDSSRRLLLATGGTAKCVRLWELMKGGGGGDGETRWEARQVTDQLAEQGKHDDAVVNCLAFDSDSTLLATGADDNTVRVWSVVSGRCLKLLHGHKSSVTSIAFGAASCVLASGGFDGTVCLWGRLEHSLPPAAAAAAAGPAESHHYSDVEEEERLEIAGGGDPLKIKSHTKAVFGVIFTKGDSCVSTSSADGTVRWRDATLQGHTGRISGVVFVDGSDLRPAIRTASADGAARLWKADGSGACLDTASLKVDPAHTVTVACSRWGVVVADQKAARLWCAATGALQVLSASNANMTSALALSDDGRAVNGGISGVHVWESSADGARPIHSFKDSVSPAALALSTDGCWLAAGGHDGRAWLWDLRPRTAAANDKDRCIKLCERPAAAITAMVFSPDSAILAVGAQDATVVLWDVTSTPIQQRRCLEHEAGGIPAGIVAFSCDGSLVAAAAGGNVRVWCTHTGNRRCDFSLKEAVHAIAFSPDGEALAVGTEDGILWLWAVDPPKQLPPHQPPDLLAGDELSALAATRDKWTLIGAGGGGHVYRCSRTVNGNAIDIAAKVVTAPTSQQRDRVQEEFSTQHNLFWNCLRVVDMIGIDDRDPFYVIMYMELLPSGSVGDYVRKHGPQSEEICRMWVHDALLGLDAIHRRQVVHRDIKPGNLLLTEDLRVKIADFGIARPSAPELPTMTRGIGSPLYMAPEVHRYGESDTCRAARDVWGLACTWLFMATGEHPRTATKHQEERPVMKEGVFSREACRLLHLMLDPDQSKRPTVAQLLADRYFHDDGGSSGEAAAAAAPVAARRTPDDGTTVLGDHDQVPLIRSGSTTAAAAATAAASAPDDDPASTQTAAAAVAPQLPAPKRAGPPVSPTPIGFH